MATFDWSGTLPGYKGEITSAQLTSRFGDVKTFLNTFNPSGAILPSPTAGTVVYGNGTNFAVTSAGTSGQFLQSNGSSPPTWTTPSDQPLTAQASNFTAASGGNYIIGSSVTQITLKNSPSVGDTFTIYPGNGTNLSGVSIIQAASGERIGGANATYVIPNDKTSYTFVCVVTGSSGDGWIVMGSPFGRQIGVDNSICQFRLTLTSGSPFVTTDQTAKTTVYATPYQGNRVASYNATTAEWEILPSAEVSVAVPSTTVTPFDVTLTHNISTGVLTLATVNWTNDTTRATAVTFQDGVPMIGSARLLGTGRTTSVSGQTQITASDASLVNIYNVKPWHLLAAPTGNWSQDTADAYASAASNTTVGQGRVTFVIPIAEILVKATHLGGTVGTNSATVAIGLDSTSANSAQLVGPGPSATSGGGYNITYAKYQGYPSVGFHYLQRLVRTSGSQDFTYTGNRYITGMLAEVLI